MPSKPSQRRYFATSPFQAPPPQPVVEYEVDDRVSHDRYGLGRVVALGGGDWVMVRFGTNVIRVKVDRALCKL